MVEGLDVILEGLVLEAMMVIGGWDGGVMVIGVECVIRVGWKE